MAKTAAITKTGGSSGSGDGTIVAQVKSWPERIRSFYSDVRTEMKKVSSPSWKEVQATTGVVIIAVFMFALYFYGVDKVMDKAILQVLHIFTR
jgi:preprotein translocase subunit SecE